MSFQQSRYLAFRVPHIACPLGWLSRVRLLARAVYAISTQYGVSDAVKRNQNQTVTLHSTAVRCPVRVTDRMCHVHDVTDVQLYRGTLRLLTAALRVTH